MSLVSWMVKMPSTAFGHVRFPLSAFFVRVQLTFLSSLHKVQAVLEGWKAVGEHILETLVSGNVNFTFSPTVPGINITSAL